MFSMGTVRSQHVRAFTQLLAQSLGIMGRNWKFKNKGKEVTEDVEQLFLLLLLHFIFSRN